MMDRYAVLLSLTLFAGTASPPLLAEKVTDLVTFQAGTPARASEVNSNFAAIKSAVDDQDTRLMAVETNKQQRISSDCSDNSAIKNVDINGNVVCEAFQKAGVLTLGPSSFRLKKENDNSYCRYEIGYPGYLRGTRNTSCVLVATVALPDAVSVTGLQCMIMDNIAGSASISSFGMTKYSAADFSGGNVTLPFLTGSIDSSEPQMLTAAISSDPGVAQVDNTRHFFELFVTFYPDGVAFDSIGAGLGLYGCRVFYAP